MRRVGIAVESSATAETFDDRDPKITPRERVLFELARRDKSNVQDTFRAITEASAVFLGVHRVSIWELIPASSPDGSDERILCRDLYLRDEQRHVTQEPLLPRAYPMYFRAIRERRIITADNARTDPRTAEFTETYLRPLGITSMMDVPIWRGGEIFGLLCHEYCGRRGPRRWGAEAESFAVHMADIAALTLESSDRRVAELRTEAILDSVVEGVVVMDTEGTIVRANPIGRRDFIDRAGGGLTLAERDQLFQFLDAEDQPIPLERYPFVRVMRGATVRDEIIGVIFKRTGERWYYRISCSPIYEGDKIKYVIFVASDISDQIYFERVKRDFIAALAHELKTPVSIVKGYAQHLEDTGGIPAESHRMLGAISRASDRMERLIDGLLDVSSVTLGRLVLTREPIDLAEITRSVVERAARSTSRRFELRVPDRVPLTGDRARIEQAIRRLIENAVRCSPDGDDVDVAIHTDDDSAVLSVRDRGSGIPAAEQSRIFEMFFQAGAGSAYDAGDLGIGLFLAREIARRHGGDIWFESAQGRGSTFFMRLPLSGVP